MADRTQTDSPFELRGRVVVVTGALGQLGQQFTRSLCEAGCRVAALDLHAERDGGEIFADLVDSEALMLISGDVTSRESLETALARIEDRWGVPYRFHPVSGTHMEILSAGEDGQLERGVGVTRRTFRQAPLCRVRLVPPPELVERASGGCLQGRAERPRHALSGSDGRAADGDLVRAAAHGGLPPD